MKTKTLALLFLSGLCVSAMANGIVGGNQNGMGPGGYIPGQPGGTPPPPPTINFPTGAGPVTQFPPPAPQSGGGNTNPSTKTNAVRK